MNIHGIQTVQFVRGICFLPERDKEKRDTLRQDSLVMAKRGSEVNVPSLSTTSQTASEGKISVESGGGEFEQRARQAAAPSSVAMAKLNEV